jgi:putative membrane protein
MQRPSQQFSASDRRQVAEAVAAAERQTSAEIVPVIAAASGRYDRAEDLVGLWTAVIALVCVATVWIVEFPESDGWDEPSRFVETLALAAAVVIGFFAGAAAATRVDRLRRLFVSHAQRRDETWSRAVQVFHDRRISRTAARSGLLIYVSLFERTAAIVADEAILRELGQSELDELCRQLVEQLKQGQPIAALTATIAAAASTLAPHFPPSTPRANELSDALVLLD